MFVSVQIHTTQALLETWKIIAGHLGADMEVSSEEFEIRKGCGRERAIRFREDGMARVIFILEVNLFERRNISENLAEVTTAELVVLYV